MDDLRDERRRTRAVTILGWLVIGCLLIVALEVISYVFLKTYASSRVSYLVYEPPTFPSRSDYNDYLARRHPVLGWPPVNDEPADTPRARKIPAFPVSTDDCITAYGNSFVFAAEVRAEQAWSSFLSERIRCRVGNFGISSYGTGQALLRFQINEHDAAPVSYLGIYPDNFKRTVNQYRYFLAGRNMLGFKPRYYLDHGMLKLAPLAKIDYEDLVSFIESPEEFLRHEAFLPDSVLGPVPVRFPYSAKVLRVALREEVGNWISGRPDWSTFIQPKHRSNALALTSAIASEFMRLCRDRDKKCFVVLFPARNEYEYFRRSGVRAIQPLFVELHRRGIPFLDLTRSFHKALGGASICPFLTDPDKCQGHFNAAGNRMVSDFLYEYLTGERYF